MISCATRENVYNIDGKAGYGLQNLLLSFKRRVNHMYLLDDMPIARIVAS